MKKHFKLLIFPTILILLAESGILHSQQWRLAKGTEGINIASMDIYYSNSDTMYALGDKFLLSTDRGETWEAICGGLVYRLCDDTACGPCTDIGALRVDAFNSKILYISLYGMDPESNDIIMTTDGGKTWKYLFIGRVAPSPFIEIDPIDKNTVYAVEGPEIIHRSSDHFQTWNTMDFNRGWMGSFVISPSNNNILYAGYLSEIIKSTDRGNSWTKLPFLVQFNDGVSLAVDPKNADIIYASLFSRGIPPGGMFKSSDGGYAWANISEGLSSDDWDVNTIAINPGNTNEIYLGTGSTQNKICFRSTNGGLKWSEYNLGLPDSGHVSGIIFSKNKIYIGVNSFGPSGIYINDIVTSIKSSANLPREISLAQNYPNPFNNSTVISYEIPEKAFIRLNIYNVLGEKVKQLVNEYKDVGEYRVEFNAGDLPSGLYFYKLRTGVKEIVRKALLVK